MNSNYLKIWRSGKGEIEAASQEIGRVLTAQAQDRHILLVVRNIFYHMPLSPCSQGGFDPVLVAFAIRDIDPNGCTKKVVEQATSLLLQWKAINILREADQKKFTEIVVKSVQSQIKRLQQGESFVFPIGWETLPKYRLTGHIFYVVVRRDGKDFTVDLLDPFTHGDSKLAKYAGIRLYGISARYLTMYARNTSFFARHVLLDYANRKEKAAKPRIRDLNKALMYRFSLIKLQATRTSYLDSSVLFPIQGYCAVTALMALFENFIEKESWLAIQRELSSRINQGSS